MPLLNQSPTVQKINDQCSLHTKLQQFFNVGGIENEPGLTIANSEISEATAEQGKKEATQPLKEDPFDNLFEPRD